MSSSKELAVASSSNSKNEKNTLCFVDESNLCSEGILITANLVDDYFVDRGNQITIGRQHHRYLQEQFLGPRQNFDLNKGLEDRDLKPIESGLELIMQYIEWKAAQIDCYDLKVITKNADFICRRGTINKMALSPYLEGGTGWNFVVDKFEETFFISEVDTDEYQEQNQSVSEQDTRMTYWGFKFESYILAQKGRKPTPNVPVSTWERTFATFATTFQQTATEPGLKVFYTGEMDGLDSQGNHVQVKTQAYKLFNNKWFPTKAMRWWIQNKTVGIEDVIVGFRNKDGIVFKVQKISLDYLDKKCPQWDGNVCFGAVQRVLNNVRQIYDELVQPGELLLIERKPNKKEVKYSIVPASFAQVLTTRFKANFKS